MLFRYILSKIVASLAIIVFAGGMFGGFCLIAALNGSYWVLIIIGMLIVEAVTLWITFTSD